MNLAEALAKLDEIDAGEVTPEMVDELSEHLELAALSARAELIQVARREGYTSGEIEDGLARFDKYIEGVSAEAISRLIKKERLN